MALLNLSGTANASIRGAPVNRSVARLPNVLVRSLAAIGAVVLAGIAPALVDAQAPAPLVIDGGTLIDGNGGTPVTDALVIVQGDRISSVSRRGQTPIPANAQVIRADGKFILPGLWDSQVSYNWYYGEVMLNYGITSTIDVGIAGEIGAPHRDAVHKGLGTRAASVHRPFEVHHRTRRRHRARNAWHAWTNAEDGPGGA